MLERINRIHQKLLKQAKIHSIPITMIYARVFYNRVFKGMMLDDQITNRCLNDAKQIHRLIGRTPLEKTLKVANRYPHDILGDKSVFQFYAQGVGLPIPKALLLFEYPRKSAWTPEGKVLTRKEDWLEFFKQLPNEFMIKPSRGMGGEKVEMFSKDGHNFKKSSELLTGEQLYQRVYEDAFYGKCIFQERLSNHPDFKHFTTSQALQTLRIQTFKDPQGIPTLFAASIKIVYGDRDTDNFGFGDKGSLWGVVDIETGTITAAVTVDENGQFYTVTKHKDSGIEVAGKQIPMWKETADLALTAAVKFSSLVAIGWDIAITPDGPVIIEGNPEWGETGKEGPWMTVEEFELMKTTIAITA